MEGDTYKARFMENGFALARLPSNRRTCMPLTDRTVANLKKSAEPHKVFDGGGLYVYVTPNGSKLWRMAYRFNGKQNTLSFGAYPAVSLKMAREKRDLAKESLARGIDPSDKAKEEKAIEEQERLTFEKVARIWHNENKAGWTEKSAAVILRRLERDIFPHVGSKPIKNVVAADILAPAKLIDSRGARDYAHRAMQYCGQIFRYAIANGLAVHNVVADLKDAIPTAKVKHHATITDPQKIGPLLRAMDAHDGYFPVSCALKLAPLVFVRPGELRGAEWSEFDLGKSEWRIPAIRMKMREQHIVPLSRQALAIIMELKEYTGHGKLLFPSVRTVDRPISDMTINSALRRIGYAKDEITGHGFRSMASTLLNELGWNRDAIERQLAHGERDQVRASYNFAEFLPERRKMMQAWADYLDSLKKTDTA